VQYRKRADYGSTVRTRNAASDKTNGNITGQVKALDSLREMLGFVGPRPGEKPDGEGDPKPQIYRATWMRKPGDPDYEEDEGVDAEE
jgi:hypothetical protein